MATAQNPRLARDRTTTARASMHPARLASMVFGVVFLVVGIAGFIPGITTNYEELMAAGEDSEAELLGLFQVSVAHNIVHLAFGVLGILAARAVAAAKWFLIGGGLLYLGLTLYGAVIDLDSDANFLPLNNADNWLHLGLGVGMIGLGLLASSAEDRPSSLRR